MPHSSHCFACFTLQPSHARLGSSWRCLLRSAPSAPLEATLLAVASASTSGTPCLLASVAWQPSWKTVPTEMTGSPVTGAWMRWRENWKLHLNSVVRMNWIHVYVSSSTWVPQRNYLESNRDECTVSLIYAVHLKKQGSVSFEYQYPDNNLLFEFFVSLTHAHYSTTCLYMTGWICVNQGFTTLELKDEDWKPLV